MIIVGECRVSANSQTHTTLCVFEKNKPHRLHRRNHERCKQASLASHSERGGFCNIGSCGCLYTYNCLYCKRYSAMQNLPMRPIYIRGSVRERRSKAKRLRQFCLPCYCRADAVKDERSEVNHKLERACPTSRGQALFIRVAI